MVKYTSSVTLFLEKELSNDDIGNLEDYISDAVFKFARKYDINFNCLSFID